MGLDKDLTGEIYLPENWSDPSKNQYVDGFRLKGLKLELATGETTPTCMALSSNSSRTASMTAHQSISTAATWP
ncbi:MAG: hypothetical protein JWO82_772 [Akkermansiaceae bacterium]|nr:hypothetical protein [Akkermansiaceae bacterium]